MYKQRKCLTFLALLASAALVSCGNGGQTTSPVSSSSPSSQTSSDDSSASSSSSAPSSTVPTPDSSSSEGGDSSSSTAPAEELPENFDEFKTLMTEKVLTQNVLSERFTVSNDLDDIENETRVTKYGENQILATIEGDDTYLQFAAIYHDIYYTAYKNSDGSVGVSRQKIAETTGIDTTTIDIAKRDIERYKNIASLDSTGVFDVFTEEGVQSSSFSRTGNTYMIGAYLEDGSSYNNYNYTLIVELNDADQIESLQATIKWADSDHWDGKNHQPNDSENSYTANIRVEQGDIEYGAYSDELLYDFDGYFLTHVEAEIYAEDMSGMGGVSGEANTLHCGDYLAAPQILSYEPENATDVDSVKYVASSDPDLIAVDQYGGAHVVPDGSEPFEGAKVTVYIGNAFHDSAEDYLDAVEVTILPSGDSSSEVSEPRIIGVDEPQENYQSSYDGIVDGIFDVAANPDQPGVFTCTTYASAPFDIQGDEITSDNPDVAVAEFQPNPQGGKKINIVIYGIMAGQTTIRVPSIYSNGSEEYTQNFTVNVGGSANTFQPDMITIEDDSFELYDTGDDYGCFTISLADGPKSYSVKSLFAGPFDFSEIVSDDPSIVTAAFEEDDNPSDMYANLVLTPHATGTTHLQIPAYSWMGGTQIETYEVVVTD